MNFSEITTLIKYSGIVSCFDGVLEKINLLLSAKPIYFQMETLLGISQYSATEYPQGTSIEKVASENEYVIKIIESSRDFRDDWYVNYKIFNKNLESQPITRNGWFFTDFQTNSSWNPGVLFPLFKDITKKSKYDYTEIVKLESFHMIGTPFGKGRGLNAINSVLEQFIDISEYKNWADYIRKKYNILIEERSIKNPTEDIKEEEIEIKKYNEMLSLKEELEKLKIENKQLKSKLKQLEVIIAKANRILQKLSQKSGK